MPQFRTGLEQDPYWGRESPWGSGRGVGAGPQVRPGIRDGVGDVAELVTSRGWQCSDGVMGAEIEQGYRRQQA